MTTKKVLLINSEPNVREVMEVCLTHVAGWRVIEAESPVLGLESALREQPDAIILDLTSSGMDYLTFLKRLRSQPLTQTIPVIVVSAGARWIDFKRLQPFQVVGAIEYMPDPTQIPNQIATLLGWGKA